jgi:excisionase family DNA binding protein
MDNPFEVIDHRLSRIEDLLIELTKHLRGSPSAAADEIGGIELAQEVTRLSKARLYALVAARHIPHAKRGNKLYFTRADLQAWIAAGRRSS